jgi:hypothetical protein
MKAADETKKSALKSKQSEISRPRTGSPTTKLRPRMATARRNTISRKDVSVHPLLAAQMDECQDIVKRFKAKGLAINEKTVRRALTRPEEISHLIPLPVPEKHKKV